MKSSPKKYAAVGSLAVLLSIASWGVLSQSTPAAEASVAEVQTYIEQRVRENSALDDVVASGLTLGYRPEVLAAALIILNFEPAAVAVALVNQGVSRRDAAQSVITVAGPPSSEPVLQALLTGITPAEGTALRGQVAQIVSSVTPVVAQETSAPSKEVPAQLEDTAAEAAASTTAPPSTTATVIADSQASQEPAPPAASTATDTTPTPPVAATPPAPVPAPPMLVGVAPPTPAVQGGGGGATRN